MMLFSEVGTNSKERKVETSFIAMGGHVNIVNDSITEAIVLHLARNAKSVVGKTTSKPYVKVEMKNMDLLTLDSKG